MGTLLQERGLRAGETPGDWNVERPDDIAAILRAYVAAGSQVVYANTFGANRLKYHGRHSLEEVIRSGLSIAHRAKGLGGLGGLEGLGGLGGLEIIETPGHTSGGVCYYFRPDSALSPLSPPLLLSGDTLFAGSIGRTDLPGGSMATLMDSLAKLTVLPDDTLVIPGHGPHPTIAAEKRGNPFLQ